MVETILNLLPDPRLWLVLIGCSILVGFCKTGIAVVGTAVVPIMALAFGARPSTGLLLPLLCLADLGAIIYYRRSCSWYHLVRLLGWAIVGLFVGTSAWFYMLLNYTKLPLQIWVWDNIHRDSLLASLLMIPFIAFGSWLGIILIKRLPENLYRHLVIWITLASAVMMLF